MTVFNINQPLHLTKSLKSISLVLMASLLFACQGETSAESVEAIVEQSTAVTTIASDPIPVTETVADAVEEVASPHHHSGVTAVPATPRAPADFSTLKSGQFKPVTEQFPVSTGEEIEVTELFWFGCGHCYQLEAPLKQWLKNKPANAKFKKVPAIFSARWEFHGKAFYTLESLNVPEKAYDDFFRQIHVQKRGINNLDGLVKFLAPFGKDKETIENAFKSFAVDSKFRNAVKITKASGARGVPAIVVDGKYLTSQTDAGGTSEMFDVVDKLVAKAASER